MAKVTGIGGVFFKSTDDHWRAPNPTRMANSHGSSILTETKSNSGSRSRRTNKTRRSDDRPRGRDQSARSDRRTRGSSLASGRRGLPVQV